MSETRTSPPRSRRVLIVEDLKDTRESIQELLQIALQIEVEVAADGVEALAMLNQQGYDLVLTDLRMPRASGMRLLREVRERQLSCPVVIVTGHGTIKDAVEAMRLGAYDFLTKPLDPQQLILLVDRILRETARE